MKASVSAVALLVLTGFSQSAAAAGGEVWLCKFKGWTPKGMEHYVVVKPFDGTPEQGLEFNSPAFVQKVFSDLAPGNRPSGDTACAMRASDISETWYKKLLAGDDYFSGPSNSTLAEWRNGTLVKVPWPKAKKK